MKKTQAEREQELIAKVQAAGWWFPSSSHSVLGDKLVKDGLLVSGLKLRKYNGKAGTCEFSVAYHIKEAKAAELAGKK